jgi:hypothetical protein
MVKRPRVIRDCSARRRGRRECRERKGRRTLFGKRERRRKIEIKFEVQTRQRRKNLPTRKKAEDVEWLVKCQLDPLI